MLSIDEAIAQAREVSGRKFDDRVHCIRCSEFHQQLAEWLEELRALRNGLNIKCDSLNDALEKGKKVGYNKAIDDCLKIVEWDGYTLDIKHRIEKLKAGEGNNES